MPRPEQLLYPQIKPVVAAPAATILLLRDSGQKPEVLMTRRSSRASFVPSTFVFPGGRQDEQDRQLLAHALTRPQQDEEQLLSAIAAIRETWEEMGILLARQANGEPVHPDTLKHMDRQAQLAPQLMAHDLKLSASDVFILSRWITGMDWPKRFDTRFFVARAPAGQAAVADKTEQFEPIWIGAQDALQRHQTREFSMIFPTIRTLQWMQGFDCVDAMLAACQGEKPLFVNCTRGGLIQGRERRFMIHDPGYGELALVCPDGQLKHSLDWQHEKPVPLLKNVQRLTAPNAGMMTGPGTNSYIIGDAASSYIVIDPGPDDPVHLQRLLDATGGNIRMIVCTHSHPDHSPGAKPLQAMCRTQPPILGLSSGPRARANSQFTPDEELADGQLLTLSSAPDSTHTLRVIHTPGHASNHLCLLLQEDGLLFSGDHILNGSTTVIDAPDGNMTQYLDSLDKLSQACRQDDVQFILPAHGWVLDEPLQVIDKLKQHRLAREAKVKAAMQARPDGDLDDWVRLAYDDVPEKIWPVAKRSLQAHVERLQSL